MSDKKIFDVFVIGSGVAGLSLIKFLSETSFYNSGVSIAVASKKRINDTNTSWAQGGIASVMSPSDSFEKHIEDTMIAGDYKNDRNIVRKVVEAAPFLINKLMHWGMPFDKTETNDLSLTLEGGHSKKRILHHKDETGFSLQNTLKNILPNNTTVFENLFVHKIVKDEKGAFHIYAIQEGKIPVHWIASVVVIATGGLGMLFESTTNQSISTGDGIYLAKQLGAETYNLCYVQFHPTGLYTGKENVYLISEAVRGEGAVLKNKNGAAFMQKYDTRQELAPRDIVSRAIFSEMIVTKSDCVYLDATHFDKSKWENHFPSIYQACKAIEIDPRKQFIPVVPVQHYSCGGIKTNNVGETSVKNLYVLGESAHTGLHGSNRLASNSLLEGLVFALFAAENISSNFELSWEYDLNVNYREHYVKKLDRSLLKQIMSDFAGVVKSFEGLNKAKIILTSEIAKASLESAEAYDIETYIMFQVAIDLIEDALSKKENTGVFFNIDLIN